MNTVEFRVENRELQYRCLVLVNTDVFQYNNEDEEPVYSDELKIHGWSEWETILEGVPYSLAFGDPKQISEQLRTL
jgi:hypothetical protein